jgi:Spy/CpxP family protein refolding chaperone
MFRSSAPAAGVEERAIKMLVMRFNPVVRYGCALLVIVCISQSASAQRSGSRTNSLSSLAANELVQKHLGITGETANRLNAINDEYRGAAQKEYTALGIDYSAISDLPAAERAVEMRKASEKSTDVNRRLAAAFLPKLQELLTPEQIQRLKQIQLQASGIDVWTEPDTARELDLSQEQQARLIALRNEYTRRQPTDGDFQQRFAKIRELNAERDAKAVELLTAAQKAKLDELKGAPFDVSQLGFRRRGNN